MLAGAKYCAGSDKREQVLVPRRHGLQSGLSVITDILRFCTTILSSGRMLDMLDLLDILDV
jgi:hypothetical protein